MKKRTLIAILGIWVAIIPSLGLPSTWKHWVIVCSGLCITAVTLKKKYIIVEDTKSAGETTADQTATDQALAETTAEKTEKKDKKVEGITKVPYKEKQDKQDTSSESVKPESTE